MYTSMKPSLRSWYSILLPMLMAATFTFRIVLYFDGSFQRKYVIPLSKTLKNPSFNDTLLSYASIDVGEAKLKQEVEDLSDGNFGNRRQKRSFLSSGKYHPNLRFRSSKGGALQLRSPEFSRLWLTFRKFLSDWWRSRRVHLDTMLDMAKEVKVAIDEFNGIKSSGKKYKSCAVVGNSGILLKNQYGKLINNHEIVIRLNNARIVGFERNVGSRTDISFVNSNILHLCARRVGCFCHPYGANVPVVMYLCQPIHMLDYLVCNSSHIAPLIVTDPGFDMLCARIVKYYSLKRFVETTGKDVREWGLAHDAVNFHYSSGMQAIMLALGVCEKVTIFGFGKSALARHHYHTNQKAELSLHDYEAEYDFYKDLMNKPRAVPFISDTFKFPSVELYL